MRPTTALTDNVIDLNALLHPGTAFEHPGIWSSIQRSVFPRSAPFSHHGVRRIRDRVMPCGRRGADNRPDFPPARMGTNVW